MALTKLLLLLLAGVVLLVLGGCRAQANDAARQQQERERCIYQHLPNSLDSVAYLDWVGMVHLQESFRVDFAQPHQNITFTIEESSYGRFYVAPHQVDIDMFLWVNTSDSAHSSSNLEQGTEEVIFTELTPGFYTLQLLYSGFIDNSQDATECSSLSMEIAIVPSGHVNDVAHGFECPEHDIVPPTDLFTRHLNEQRLEPLHYWNDSLVVRGESSATHDRRRGIRPDIRVVAVYPLNLPLPQNRTKRVWTLRASLGYDFLTGGSLGFALLAQDVAVDTHPHDCTHAAGCILATNTRKNEKTIVTSLAGGEYSLVLFDALGDRQVAVSPCSPFSFDISIESIEEEENQINCMKMRLPNSFNSPGYLSSSGTMHIFGRYYLDPLSPTELYKVFFTIANPSFLRVFIDEHEIDLDLMLMRRGMAGSIATSAQFDGVAEGILTYLEPGSYILHVLKYGSYSYRFCDSFYFEAAISTTSALAVPTGGGNYCQGLGTPRKPDFSALRAALEREPYSYDIPLDASTPYTWNLFDEFHQQVIFEEPFSLATRSVIVAEVHSNFLLADMTMSLVGAREDARAIASGRHYGNLIILDLEVQPGTYTLNLTTGITQSRRIVHTSMPNCMRYFFSIRIVPVAESSPCQALPLKLPSSLSTPVHLDTLNWLVLDGEYEIPPAQLLGARHWEYPIDFTLRLASLVHLHIEEHIDSRYAITADIRQQTDDSHSVQVEFESKEFTTSLPPGQYQLRILVQHVSGVSHKLCPSFLFKLHLYPTPATPPESCTASMPPESIFNAQRVPYLSIGNYTYLRSADATLVTRTLSIASPLLARIVVHQDDIASNVRVTVVRADDGTVLSNDANNQVLSLEAGTYSVQIRDAGTPLTILHGCARFSLLVAFARVVQSSGPGVCTYELAPRSLNTIAYMSDYSANSAHFQRAMLADSRTGFSDIRVTLTMPSVIRLYAPAVNDFNVDLAVFTVDDSGQVSATPLVASANPDGAESLWLQHDGGHLSLRVSFVATTRRPLPPMASCPVYELELAVVPVLFLHLIPHAQAPCEAITPPQELDIQSEEAHQYALCQYPFAPATRTTVAELTFQLAVTSLFYADLGYAFAFGHVTMKLSGALVNENNIYVVDLEPLYSLNHEYLEMTLEPGEYTLTIREAIYEGVIPAESTPQCVRYHLVTQVVAQGSNVDDGSDASSCDHTNQLPTDLFTTEGGSVPYGGPQQPETGNIRLSGTHFETPAVNTRLPVDFKVYRASYLRIFAHGEHGTDIDFYLWSASNTEYPIHQSSGVQDIESAVWRLEPGDYTLQVAFYSVPAELACSYYHFELDLRDEETVASQLLCPGVLPSPEVPPANMRISEHADTGVYASNYVFTQQRMNDTASQESIGLLGSLYRYRMTIVVDSTVAATIRTYIEFDFLANDFRLRLSRVIGRDVIGLVYGESDLAPDHEESFDFRNELEATLEAGTYYLDILEDVTHKPFTFPSYCHAFGFAFSGSARTDARVSFVDPPGGNNLNPVENLALWIVFSESLGSPKPSALLSTITSSAAVRLLRNGNPQSNEAPAILPTQAEYNNERSAIHVIFDSTHFSLGDSLLLDINTSIFRTNEGESLTEFDLMTHSHWYIFMDCDCSGHGRCSISGTNVVCECDPLYAGPRCNSCVQDYHMVRDQCVANARCDEHTCNGHGTCSDTNGNVRCVCERGYATAGDRFCSVCAAGYTNYPECYAVPPAVDRPTLCTAPLLPTDLAGISYLGYDGQMHLEGVYFIDTKHQSHAMLLRPTVASVIRVFVGAHASIDVDLFLGRQVLVADGNQTGDAPVFRELASSRSPNHGLESLLVSLEAGVLYQLRLEYAVLDLASDVSCETLRFELELKPTSVVHSELSSYSAREFGGSSQTLADAVLCNALNSSANALPLAERPQPMLLGPGAFSYRPGTERPQQFTVYNTENKYFFSKTFRVIDVPPNHRPRIHVKVDYQFLLGQLVIVLERQSSNHCGLATPVEHPNCIVGESTINANQLDAVIMRSQNYTLWLYQTELANPHAVALCSQFAFEFDVTFERIEEDIWRCAANRLPSSLNEFMSHDTMHLYDRFFIPDSVRTTLTLQQSSLVRLSMRSPQALTVRARNTHTGRIETFEFSDSGLLSLVGELHDGEYELEFNRWAVHRSDSPSSQAFCATTTIELAVTPMQLLRARVACSLPSESLPSISTSTPLTVPYSFGFSSDDRPTTTTFNAFYANHPPLVDNDQGPMVVVAEYPIAITSQAFLMAAVASDFLLHHAQLRMLKNGRFVYGTDRYNLNHLEQLLAPGNYTLQLVLPAIEATQVYRPTCAPFNFWLQLSDYNPERDRCQLEGEPLPVSLNGLRFLGTDGSKHVHYRSNRYRASSTTVTQRQWSKFISLETAHDEELVMRVLVTPWAGVGMRIELVRVDSDAAGRLALAVVAQGVPDGTPSVSLVHRLEPSTHYRVVLFFSAEASRLPPCPTFAMEIAAAPPVPLPRECPQHGMSHWNPLIQLANPFDTPYYYDSSNVDNNGTSESLYVQQRTGGVRSHYNTLQVSRPANVRVELGYEFLTGDLSVALEVVRKDSNSWYFGFKQFDKTVLHIMGLPSGTYKLWIYESITNEQSIMGCSYWTLRIAIVPYQVAYFSRTEYMRYPTLPRSLDTIGALAYNGRVHLSGDYALFHAGSLASSNATLESTLRADRAVVRFSVPYNTDTGSRTSLLRITVSPLRDRDLDHPLRLFLHAYSQNKTFGVGAYDWLLELPSDSYTLEIVSAQATTMMMSRATVPVLAHVELEIAPTVDAVREMHELELRIDAEHSCATTTAWPPIEYYQAQPFVFAHDQMLLSPSDLAGQSVLQLAPVTLQSEAYVFVRVETQFLPTALMLTLVQEHDAASGRSIAIMTSRADRNAAELYYKLPAGNYTVYLQQPSMALSSAAFQSFVSPAAVSDLHHCGVYGLRIAVAADQYRFDCSRFATLPHTVAAREPDGDGQPQLPASSAPYGGPIDADGVLYFYGEQFLFPTALGGGSGGGGGAAGESRPQNEQSSWGTIELPLVGGSIVSVYTMTAVQTDVTHAIGHSLVRQPPYAAAFVPLLEHSSSLVHHSVFDVDGEIQPLTVDLILSFAPPSRASGTDAACPYYTLAINVLPKAKVPDRTFCYDSPWQPPPRVIPLDEEGFGERWLSTRMPSALFGNEMPVRFTVVERTLVHLSVAFDATLSDMSLQLTGTPDLPSDPGVSLGDFVPVTSDHRAQPKVTRDASQLTNTEAVIHQILWPGTYVLMIRTHELEQVSSVLAAQARPGGHSTDYCVPFTFTAQLSPVGNGPTITMIEPGGAIAFPQNTDLELRVTLSEPAYYETGLVSNANPQPIVYAFGLRVPGAEESNDLLPVRATAIGDSAVQWSIIFRGTALRPGTTYLLVLHERILTNKLNEPFVGPQTPAYSIVPTCSAEQHQHLDLATGRCLCNPGYAGASCSMCADGYTGYPNCAEATMRCPVCIHGTCDMQTFTCVCDGNWAGATCNECSVGFTGEQCNTCAPHFQAPSCDSCEAHWAGTTCSICNSRFRGEQCDECIPRFMGPDCTQCVPPFTGPDCTECRTGFAGPFCDHCAEHFVGTNCDRCAPHWSGAQCTECANHWSGSDCSVCLRPFAGEQCDQCAGHFVGPRCDECAHGWAGEQCDRCAPRFKGDDCSECEVHFDGADCSRCAHGWGAFPECNRCDVHFTGENCDRCAPGWSGVECNVCDERWAGEQCDECKYPFAGPDCRSCQGRITGVLCTECLPGWAGPNCDRCAEHFVGPNCDRCELGWSGPQCSECADHFTGPNCDSCEEWFTGADCSQCVPNRAGDDCASCAWNWAGANCEECREGFTGDDCQAQENTLDRLQTYQTVGRLAGVIACALGIAVGIAGFIYYKVKRARMVYQPVLDLDDDEGFEMEQNLMDWEVRDEEPDAQELS